MRVAAHSRNAGRAKSNGFAQAIWYPDRMCRIAGYLGSPVTLDALLTKAPHALRMQAHAPRELPPGTVGSDGYGVAWFSKESALPALYRQTLPIWTDLNLDTLAPHVRSSCVVASTRTATERMPVAITNTPPFCVGATALVHNGSIAHFHERVLEPLRSQLGPEQRRELRGNSDSEYLAALLAEASASDLTERVIDLLSRLTKLLRAAQSDAQLTLMVADGRQLVAVRYAIDQEAPSLYFAEHWSGGTLVASEPMDDSHAWTRLGADSILTLQPGAPPAMNRLELH
jgi:gamma-glutamyl hercynylcysteine S-oxide hydrolase